MKMLLALVQRVSFDFNFMSVYFVENSVLKVILFILSFIFLIIGVSVALKIETEEGYYECQKCHHKYIPSYQQVYFAMHYGRTRYMKCPHCQKEVGKKRFIQNKNSL